MKGKAQVDYLETIVFEKHVLRLNVKMDYLILVYVQILNYEDSLLEVIQGLFLTHWNYVGHRLVILILIKNEILIFNVTELFYLRQPWLFEEEQGQLVLDVLEVEELLVVEVLQNVLLVVKYILHQVGIGIGALAQQN